MYLFMESKHSTYEAKLIKKILGNGPKSSRESAHPVLIEDWKHAWDSDQGDSTAHTHHFSYIKNPTGTIRWFFPSATPYPAYLGLYNSAHLKARVYKLITFIAFSLGFQKRLFDGSFSIQSSDLPFDRLIKLLDADTYAVFTGTEGENRKSVVAIYRGKSISHFVKLAQTDTAKLLLKNEADTLKKLNEIPFFRLDHPRVHPDSQPGCLILSNIKPVPAREIARLEDMQLEVMDELYKFTHKELKIAEADFFKEIHENLARICTREIADPHLDTPTTHRLIDHLLKLSQGINPEKTLTTSLAHGDFTPWNMYLSENYVHVYDWELASEGKPLFYDFFHYMYQSGVLLLRQDFGQIQREISRSLRLPHASKIISLYNMDVKFYQKLYLLSIVSYYLRVYMDEPKVHMQVHWLVDIWEQAVGDIY